MTEQNMMYKAFDGIAIEIYEDGELIRTHFVPTFREAHFYAKKVEQSKGIEIRFCTCDEWGNIIDRL